MRSIRLDSRARRGATIALVAVCLAATLAVGALAVDTGMLFKVRADAQRAADAGALAGAAEFLKTEDALSARQPAVDRALEYAGRNYMGGRNIDVGGVQSADVGSNGTWTVESNEARVEVAPAIFRVRVTIHRAETGTLFANLLGISNAAISAYAAAEALDAGGSNCVMPFAVPDIWGDANDDINDNRIEDSDEDWEWDPGTDSYSPFDPPDVNPSQTGYGGGYRNGYANENGEAFSNDIGRQIVLKPQDPREALAPGNFGLWEFDDNNGSPGLEERITGCDPRTVELGVENAYHIVPGDSVGQTRSAVEERIAQDEREWNQSTLGAELRNSPRIVKVALYDPQYIAGNGPLVFNNIGLFFLDFAPGKGPYENVVGHFLKYASGSPGGETTGPLVKRIRLVE